MFSSEGGRVHTVVRQRMRDLFESNNELPFLDTAAQRFLAEARVNYAALGLGRNIVLEDPKNLLLFTWMGDATNAALACMLRAVGIKATHEGLAINIDKSTGHDESDIIRALHTAATVQMPSLEDMLPEVAKIKQEKWDWALPDDLLRKAYASMRLNLPEAQEWAANLTP